MKKVIILFVFIFAVTTQMVARVFDGVNYQKVGFGVSEEVKVAPSLNKYSGTVFIPTSVGTNYRVAGIGNGAFKDCFNLETAILPTSLKYISDYAFECSGISYLDIPSNVNAIGKEAFSGCKKLTAIVLPESMMNIGKNAFKDCVVLIQVTVLKKSPVKIFPNSFPDRTRQTLYVPKGSKVAYEKADYWCEFKEIVEIEG